MPKSRSRGNMWDNDGDVCQQARFKYGIALRLRHSADVLLVVRQTGDSRADLLLFYSGNHNNDLAFVYLSI